VEAFTEISASLRGAEITAAVAHDSSLFSNVWMLAELLCVA